MRNLAVRRLTSPKGSSIFSCLLLVVALWGAVVLFHATVDRVDPSIYHGEVPSSAPKLSDVVYQGTGMRIKGGNAWIEENSINLRRLFDCLQEANDCPSNQRKVVMLSEYRFNEMLWSDKSGGEWVWANSTITALRKLNYTLVHTNSPQHAVLMHHMLQDLVVMILWDSIQAEACFADKDNCIRSEQNPAGIPAWKIFSMHWWKGAANPLGWGWTLHVEDFKEVDVGWNTHLGYSVEPICRTQTVIPPSEKKRRAYILAKERGYFNAGKTVWPIEFFNAAVKGTGVRFVAGLQKDAVEPHDGIPEADPVYPEGLVDYGPQSRPGFLRLVAESSVLVGLGDPRMSPTPYEALCVGVPFLNPVENWDSEHPHDRTKWTAQHDALKWLDPPYVYNVFTNDRDGFVRAIKSSLDNPIPSYIPPWATEDALQTRLENLLNTDWKAKAENLLRERKKSGTEPLFLI